MDIYYLKSTPNFRLSKIRKAKALLSNEAEQC